MKHIGKIFAWALVSATVGIILRAVSERSGTLGRIVIALIGMGIVSASLDGIFVAALYNFANSGKIPSAYSPEVIRGAFQPKNTQATI